MLDSRSTHGSWDDHWNFIRSDVAWAIFWRNRGLACVDALEAERKRCRELEVRLAGCAQANTILTQEARDETSELSTLRARIAKAGKIKPRWLPGNGAWNDCVDSFRAALGLDEEESE